MLSLYLKQYSLINFYKNFIFTEEFDTEGAFQNKSNKNKHNIYINKTYLDLDKTN